MNKLIQIILTTLVLATPALALDPTSGVALDVNGDGSELRLYKSALPKTWNRISNYHKAGEAQWAADGWVQAKSVKTAFAIDRTATEEVPIYDPVDTNVVIGTETVFVDKEYATEANLIQRASAALEVVQPARPGIQTLALIKEMTTEEFIAAAKTQFANADAGTKPAILAAITEIIALFQEATLKGIDWRADDFGSPNKTETVTTIEVVP